MSPLVATTLPQGMHCLRHRLQRGRSLHYQVPQQSCRLQTARSPAKDEAAAEVE